MRDVLLKIRPRESEVQETLNQHRIDKLFNGSGNSALSGSRVSAIVSCNLTRKDEFVSNGWILIIISVMLASLSYQS